MGGGPLLRPQESGRRRNGACSGASRTIGVHSPAQDTGLRQNAANRHGQPQRRNGRREHGPGDERGDTDRRYFDASADFCAGALTPSFTPSLLTRFIS